MKKLITVLATILSLNAYSLGFTISLHSFNSASKPNDAEFVELNMVDTKKTGTEIVNIIMVHVNSDNTISDSLVLFSFPITDWTKYNYGTYDRRIWFTIPEMYANGKFRITVSYCKAEIFSYYMAPTVGVNDEILETKETPQYYDLNGKLLVEPKGLCIEVINGISKRICKL